MFCCFGKYLSIFAVSFASISGKIFFPTADFGSQLLPFNGIVLIKVIECNFPPFQTLFADFDDTFFFLAANLPQRS